MRVSFVALVFVFAIGSACNSPAVGLQERNPQLATDFFTSGPRIGLDPDAGLYRYTDAGGGMWEHVATVHAMGNDMEFCEDLVAALKANPLHKHPFTCRLLNK